MFKYDWTEKDEIILHIKFVSLWNIVKHGSLKRNKLMCVIHSHKTLSMLVAYLDLSKQAIACIWTFTNFELNSSDLDDLLHLRHHLHFRLI